MYELVSTNLNERARMTRQLFRLQARKPRGHFVECNRATVGVLLTEEEVWLIAVLSNGPITNVQAQLTLNAYEGEHTPCSWLDSAPATYRQTLREDVIDVHLGVQRHAALLARLDELLPTDLVDFITMPRVVGGAAPQPHLVYWRIHP